MNDRVRATATVKLTLVVPVGTWGEGCKLDQVHSQASQEANVRVKKLVEGTDITVSSRHTPEITTTIVRQ